MKYDKYDIVKPTRQMAFSSKLDAVLPFLPDIEFILHGSAAIVQLLQHISMSSGKSGFDGNALAEADPRVMAAIKLRLAKMDAMIAAMGQRLDAVSAPTRGPPCGQNETAAVRDGGAHRERIRVVAGD